ncbi:hypothetical protein KFK09_014542 [Dendrobium nobile]|uniref:Uncharacterized protein n=1 Tax=Dendrobium nobile TaxID=94219 RepID=A0A8T3B3D0_DENNO|nr:hypothetical protein KFK09_014542 [Dendrobium nobile]
MRYQTVPEHLLFTIESFYLKPFVWAQPILVLQDVGPSRVSELVEKTVRKLSQRKPKYDMKECASKDNVVPRFLDLTVFFEEFNDD